MKSWRQLSEKHTYHPNPIIFLIFVLQDSPLMDSGHCVPLMGDEYWFCELNLRSIGHYLSTTEEASIPEPYKTVFKVWQDTTDNRADASRVAQDGAANEGRGSKYNCKSKRGHLPNTPSSLSQHAKDQETSAISCCGSIKTEKAKRTRAVRVPSCLRAFVPSCLRLWTRSRKEGSRWRVNDDGRKT